MNILLTSVGRRAYMVKFFKDVIGNTGMVHVCNSDRKTVAFKYADKAVVSPLIYDEGYIPFLDKYCKQNRIDIILSLFDIDLLMLSQHKKRFEANGTRVIVSDESIVAICNDKWKTYEFLVENGFFVPKTYKTLSNVLDAINRNEIAFPIVVKPRYGCGSISVTIAYDEEDLRYLAKKVDREISNSYLKYESAVTKDKVIFQECLKGQEYGADIINDLDGQFQNVIIRKKIAMRSGETDIAELVEKPSIKVELERLGRVTHHIANMDCDVFLIDDTPYILEMNARFGGGYPFSHMGGCNLPRAIIEWSKGNTVDSRFLAARTGITGYKELIVVEE